MKSICFILLAFCPLLPAAQNIEPLDSLTVSINRCNQKDCDEQLILLHKYRDKHWLALMPSIGFDPFLNRPLIHFSLNNFIAMRSRRMEIAFQSSQIRIRFRQQLIADTINCRMLYQEFIEMVGSYHAHLKLLDSSAQLLTIKINENREVQATIEDVLKIKLELERSRLSILDARKQIAAKALQISLLIKRPLTYDIQNPSHP